MCKTSLLSVAFFFCVALGCAWAAEAIPAAPADKAAANEPDGATVVPLVPDAAPAPEAPAPQAAPAAEEKPAAEQPATEKPAVILAAPVAPPEKKPANPPAKKEKGKPGAAPAAAAAGDGPGASYFGVKAEGNRFVFVVDNSASMVKGRFDTACYEIVNTVHGLTEQQEFYVVLFSDTAYPLFYPKSANGYVKATRQNKDRLYDWLKNVPCVLGTNANLASTKALEAKPDAIFLLTDGAFTDNTTKTLLAMPKADTKIFTLSMNPANAGAADRDLKQIAEHFGGTFTKVGVNPQFATIERPYYRVRTGDWGLAIKAKPKK